MKIVALKSSVLVLFVLLFSCNRTIVNSEKKESTSIKNTDSIITDSDKTGFIGDLIETQKVPKGDTVLFRNWQVLDEYGPIVIQDDKFKFTLVGDKFCKVYKTGEQKLTKYKITILDKINEKSFNIYGIALLYNDLDAYNMNQPSSNPAIQKLSRIVGRFDFTCPLYKEYYIDFKIKNNAVNIVKLSNLSYSYSETYKYELDTLIFLRNNSCIYPDSLRSILCKEKNRIHVKDPRK